MQVSVYRKISYTEIGMLLQQFQTFSDFQGKFPVIELNILNSG